MPSLQRVATPAFRDGRQALQKAQPVLEFIRPYAPELTGWLRDFGQGASNYDANGHYARIQPIFNAFQFNDNPAGGVLTPIPPSERFDGLETNQLRRCPGAASQPAADGSAPWRDTSGTLDCDPEPGAARAMRTALPVAAVLIVAALAALFLVTSEEDDAYRVRAIFDNAGFIIPGEDVKIAGVKVGSIEDVEVTDDFKAAVVFKIDDPGYQDFRADAQCIVRPQSLIGEKFVECEPTQKRAVGAEPPGKLRQIEEGPGEGQYLLPVENTTKAVDLDLLNDIMREPERERLSIILNELGVGLAGRGADLNQVIRRANPALKEVDKVLRLLARQNDQLEQLAVDSDTIMAPLARERAHASSAIANMAAVARATAERRDDLQADIERLPRFLRELRPTMVRLGALSDEMTPVMSDLGDVAPDINRFLLELGPFSQAGIPALDSLGEASKIGTPAVQASLPVIRDVGTLASAGEAGRQDARQRARVVQEERRHRARDGLHLLPGRRRQRLRLVRPLPARRPDRQPVHDLRGRPDDRLLGELPQGERERLGGRRREHAARQRAGVDRAGAGRRGPAAAAAQEREPPRPAEPAQGRAPAQAPAARARRPARPAAVGHPEAGRAAPAAGTQPQQPAPAATPGAGRARAGGDARADAGRRRRGSTPIDPLLDYLFGADG